VHFTTNGDSEMSIIFCSHPLEDDAVLFFQYFVANTVFTSSMFADSFDSMFQCQEHCLRL
jgi:hypothetical protein